MAELDFVLYDTVPFGATANAEFNLFQITQGGDSTHNEQFTNMRGAGALPQNESFKVNWIGVVVDFQTVKADVDTMFNSSFLEVRVADFSRLKAPTALFVSNSAYGGGALEATIVDTITVGLMGDGFHLNIPIDIKGGDPFRVRVVQGPAITAASNMKVCLRGTYSIAGAS